MRRRSAQLSLRRTRRHNRSVEDTYEAVFAWILSRCDEVKQFVAQAARAPRVVVRRRLVRHTRVVDISPGGGGQKRRISHNKRAGHGSQARQLMFAPSLALQITRTFRSPTLGRLPAESTWQRRSLAVRSPRQSCLVEQGEGILVQSATWARLSASATRQIHRGGNAGLT